jgi:uncharacterized phage protein (TIGR02216 family)
MALAFGRLGMSPAVFWSLTPRELAAALAPVAAPRGDAVPMRRADLDRLAALYPDL